jgi:asparagine synthase (glutamine-hydrolysing)
MIGEVYSYRNLPHDFNLADWKERSELDFILHLYSKYGLEFVNFLNGSFLLAIWDSEAKKLVITDDRYSLFPLYYAKCGDLFLFASEVKSILKLKSFPRILDERSIADFFSFGYILGNRTLLKDVKLLPPACICIADSRKNDITLKEYWDPSFVEDKRTRLESVPKTLGFLLKNSVSKRIPKKKRFGLALSGGIDSRTILAEIEPNRLNQVFAFTLGMKEGSSDLPTAKMICDRLQISHHFYRLTAENLRDFARKAVSLTDGMWPFQHSYGSYAVYPELKKHFDIVFVGTAGELFHGRNNLLGDDILNAANDNGLAEILFRKDNLLIPYDEQERFFSPNYKHIVKYSFHDLREEITKAGDMSMVNKADYFYLWNRVRRFMNLGLVHLGSFFDCKTPFFDYDLIDYIQTVPQSIRLSKVVQRQVFSTSYCPELGNVPYARYLGLYNIPMAKHLVPGRLEATIGSYLSNAWTKSTQILQSMTSARIKSINPHPIADVNYWFRMELRDFIEGILLDSETLARPYFNQRYVAELVRAHMTGKKNLAHILGALVTFELWHRMFFDK